MKIANSAVSLSAQHRYEQTESVRASLEFTRGTPRPLVDGGGAQTRISSIGRALATEAPALQQIEAAEDAADRDPTLRLIKQMVEIITGHPLRLLNAADLGQGRRGQATPVSESRPPPTPSSTLTSPSMAIDYHAHREESEQLTVSAEGTLTTADGQSISFRLDLTMSRHYEEQLDISLRSGSARRTDPLVLDFTGNGAQLSNQRMRFDLNSDGHAENIPLLAGGSAYLVLDRNGNGKVDQGMELFGPTSNSGFRELAIHDHDSNGWIDENDPIFAELLLWTPSLDGTGKLESLKQKAVGALYLGQISSPFELRDDNNQDLGSVNASSIYLDINGAPKLMQEIDLTV
jgi:hypothetical protein